MDLIIIGLQRGEQGVLDVGWGVDVGCLQVLEDPLVEGEVVEGGQFQAGLGRVLGCGKWVSGGEGEEAGFGEGCEKVHGVGLVVGQQDKGWRIGCLFIIQFIVYYNVHRSMSKISGKTNTTNLIDPK